MNGVELFLLGRTLMKIGEQAMPEPAAGARGSVRAVLVTLGEIVANPGTTVGEIAARTGLPQSQVSTAVARLTEAGSVTTDPDPADRRRRLIHPAPEPSSRVTEVRTTTIDTALAAALTTPNGTPPTPATLHTVTEALATLAHHLGPAR
ncbi:helix-turn-helix domain-containing protein [Kitasatospora sp. NPDC097605]|uniref:MarR family transcriptional regulator n=1 Tax=Kitasatospora sp. NPDC097605 TaxID=3157226 RepID=UPI003327C009